MHAKRPKDAERELKTQTNRRSWRKRDVLMHEKRRTNARKEG
jgi:hypothetical protein